MTRTFERCPGCGAITWEGEAPSHRHRPPCPHEGASDFESLTFTPLDVPRTLSPRGGSESESVTRMSRKDLTRKEST